MSYPINSQQQFVPQAQSMPSCGAVSINIMNPTVGYPMQNPGVLYQYPQGSYYSNAPQQMQYPHNYNNMNTNVGNPINAVSNNPPTPPAPATTMVETPKEEKTAEKKKDEEPKTKVILTDDYIKSLENYLNSQDDKIRLIGAKELLERFKEDDTRKNDAALSALLNKVLQDPNSAVRFLGLTALDTQYAKGNEETVGILQNIQASNQGAEAREDSLLASQILLKMSAGDKVPVETNKETK